MNKINNSISIVGGGIAGSYLAYILAKSGIDVTIFDHSHPREKSCGGGVGAFGYEKYKFLRKLKSAKILKACKLISPFEDSIIIPTDDGVIFSRKESDLFILNKAIDNGALFLNEKVYDIRRRLNKKWLIVTKRKRVTSNILIGADGVNSIVRRKLLSPIKMENLALTINYYINECVENYSTLKFLKSHMGYMWVFPRKTHTSIGVGGNIKNVKKTEYELKRYIKMYYDNYKILDIKYALIPIIKNIDFWRLPACGPNWAIIGDAAGHVDPITGEGILFALWDAELLAKNIVEGNINQYEIDWRNSFGNNFIFGSRLLPYFYNDFILEIIIKLAKMSDTWATIVYQAISSKLQYQNIYKELIRKSPNLFIDLLNLSNWI